MNYRTFLSVLAFIILCFFANKWYQQKFCCNDVVAAEKIQPKSEEVTKQTGPIINRWGSEDVVTSNKWLIRKSEIMAGKGDKDILEIIGGYYKDEVNKTSHANLGLARAENAKILMMDKVDQSKMRTTGTLLNGTVTDKKMALELVDFRWIESPESKEENTSVSI